MVATDDARIHILRILADGGLPCEAVSTPEILADGWESVIYSIDAVSGGVSIPLVVRMYNGPWAKYKAAAEFKGMRRLMELGYPVPAVHAMDPEGGCIGQPFMIMERVDGIHLGKAFDNAPEEDKGRIGDAFFDTFTDLHKMDWRDLDPTAMGIDPTDPYSFFDKRVEWITGLAEGDSLAELRSVYATLAERRSEVPCHRYCILHGDYHPGNILLRADGRPAVLDWSMLTVGDPRYDLAWSLLISGGLDSDEKFDWMVASYWRSLGEEPRDMSLYMALASAFRLGVAVMAMGAGSSSLGLREDTAGFMRRSRGHYEAVYRRYTLSTGRREGVFDGLMDWMH